MNNFRGISYYLKANREPGEISTLYLIQVGNILGAMVWFPLYLTLPPHTISSRSSCARACNSKNLD